MYAIQLTKIFVVLTTFSRIASTNPISDSSPEDSDSVLTEGVGGDFEIQNDFEDTPSFSNTQQLLYSGLPSLPAYPFYQNYQRLPPFNGKENTKQEQRPGQSELAYMLPEFFRFVETLMAIMVSNRPNNNPGIQGRNALHYGPGEIEVEYPMEYQSHSKPNFPQQNNKRPSYEAWSHSPDGSSVSNPDENISQPIRDDHSEINSPSKSIKYAKHFNRYCVFQGISILKKTECSKYLVCLPSKFNRFEAYVARCPDDKKFSTTYRRCVQPYLVPECLKFSPPTKPRANVPNSEFEVEIFPPPSVKKTVFYEEPIYRPIKEVSTPQHIKPLQIPTEKRKEHKSDVVSNSKNESERELGVKDKSENVYSLMNETASNEKYQIPTYDNTHNTNVQEITENYDNIDITTEIGSDKQYNQSSTPKTFSGESYSDDESSKKLEYNVETTKTLPSQESDSSTRDTRYIDENQTEHSENPYQTTTTGSNIASPKINSPYSSVRNETAYSDSVIPTYSTSQPIYQEEIKEPTKNYNLNDASKDKGDDIVLASPRNENVMMASSEESFPTTTLYNTDDTEPESMKVDNEIEDPVSILSSIDVTTSTTTSDKDSYSEPYSFETTRDVQPIGTSSSAIEKTPSVSIPATSVDPLRTNADESINQVASEASINYSDGLTESNIQNQLQRNSEEHIIKPDNLHYSSSDPKNSREIDSSSEPYKEQDLLLIPQANDTLTTDYHIMTPSDSIKSSNENSTRSIPESHETSKINSEEDEIYPSSPVTVNQISTSTEDADYKPLKGINNTPDLEDSEARSIYNADEQSTTDADKIKEDVLYTEEINSPSKLMTPPPIYARSSSNFDETDLSDANHSSSVTHGAESTDKDENISEGYDEYDIGDQSFYPVGDVIKETPYNFPPRE